MSSKLGFFLLTYGMPLTIGFFALIIWSFVWKGIALWKAARKNDKYWFMALLIINTVGILEILYIYIFSKRKIKKEAEKIN